MTDTDIDGLVKRLNWLAASLEADAKSKGIGQGSEGARCSVSAADALQSMQREVAELEKERDRLILAIADHQNVRSEYVGRIAELEGQRDAYNEKFQTECAKHDVTTHQRMQADRRVAELEAQIATRGEPVAYQILLASGRWADCAKRIYDAMEASGRSEAIRKLFTAPVAVPPDYVWLWGNKTAFAVFDSEETANMMNSGGASTWIQPIKLLVIRAAAPKKEQT